MIRQIRKLLAVLPMMVLLNGGNQASAQNVQQWLQNEAGQIQGSYGSGLINQNQAAQLQNRGAQIVSQDQRYLQQNGGQLTPQESRQIGSELRHLNQHLRGDVYHNNPSLNNGTYPQGSYNRGWGNQYGQSYPMNSGWPNQFNYPSWYQNNPQAFQQLSPQQQSAFYRYYRHHYQ